jgi:hypothetical protein
MRILLVVVLLVSCVQAAVACEGQKGKVIFEDTFADDGGGWIFSNDVLFFKAPGAEYRLRPTANALASMTSDQTFYAGEGDYCLEIAFPQDQPGTRFAAGLTFLGSADDKAYFFALMYDDGDMGLFRSSGQGPPDVIWNVNQKANAKLSPGQFNAIEAIVKDNVITVLLNGIPVKAVRAQIPSGNLKFGIRVERVTPNEAGGGAAFPVKSFKVTEARKLASDTKTSP